MISKKMSIALATLLQRYGYALTGSIMTRAMLYSIMAEIKQLAANGNDDSEETLHMIKVIEKAHDGRRRSVTQP